MPRSAIMITRSRKLSLKLVYQLTHKTMICRSKCRPLNRSSIGTNRCISSSSPPTRVCTRATGHNRSLLITHEAFATVFDTLESVGNVLHNLGKPLPSVRGWGATNEYSYAAFHSFEFPFVPAVGAYSGACLTRPDC